MTQFYLEIYFNKHNQMKCFLVDEENNSMIIELKKGNDIYTPSISFNMNFITICEENENSINFVKDWMEEPEVFKEYEIYYQNKEYHVISEVLFALMIYEIKKKVQRKVKLIQTRVHVPSTLQFVDDAKATQYPLGE